MGEVIDFATAKKKRYTDNKFAAQLAEIAEEIRAGAFDPDMLFIAFRAPNPDGPGVVYPMADMDMDRVMVDALRRYLATIR